MPVLGAPGVFLAGVLAALVPLALHLLRRRQGEPQPLPTTRFLEPDPRSRVRVSAPDQPLLLALRMLLLILAGAALAQPGWLPRPSGRGEIVLIDRAVGGTSAASGAIAEVRRRLAGSERGMVVVFDSANAEVLDALPESFGAAAPARPAALEAGLAAVPGAARALSGVDSVRLTVVSALTEEAWSPGTGALRAAAWPGRISLLPVPTERDRDSVRGAIAEAAVVASRDGGYFLRTALEAGGLRLTDSAATMYRIAPPRPGQPTPAGSGRLVLDAAAIGGAPRDLPGTLVLTGMEPISATFRRVALRLEPGEALAGAWEDGSAAVAARRDRNGCRIRFGAGLEGASLPYSPAYPRLVTALAGLCDPVRAASAPLDPGGREYLAGTGGEWVAARSAGAGLPVPLGRWLMLAALVVALCEAILSHRSDRRAA